MVHQPLFTICTTDPAFTFIIRWTLSPETINIAAQNQVIVFALPPHTTHIAQPLDRGCFAPLKTAWRQLCHKFITDNPGRTVTQYDFSQLFSKAWSAAFSIHNITSSFKVTGVYPFDQSVFTEANAPENKEEEQFSLFNPDALARRTGLAYIPLYSPAIKKDHQLPAHHLNQNMTQNYLKQVLTV